MKIIEPLLYYKYNTKNIKDLQFEYIESKFEKKIFGVDKPYEGFLNAYSCIFKKDNQIRLYYRAGNIKDSDKMSWDELTKLLGEFLKDYEYLCVAVSNDGLNFVKPDMRKVKYDKEIKAHNNIIRKDYFCHNFFVNYDENLKKYIGISGLKSHNDGIFLFESNDGYKWEKKNKILDDNNLVDGWRHPNHFDTLSVLVYNNEFKKYYCYTRHNANNKPSRQIQVAESNDLKTFSKCRLVRMSEFGDNNEIYLPGVMIYPGTNYFIANTCSHDIKTIDKVSLMMISNDGINFELICDKIFKGTKGSEIPVYGMIEMNDKFYMYVLENHYTNKNSFLCYSYEKDRIGCLRGSGSFNTKLIKIIDGEIELNFETIGDGFIDLEVYNMENNLIEKIENIRGNEINKNIKFQNNDKEIYMKFILNNSKIYCYSYNQ